MLAYRNRSKAQLEDAQRHWREDRERQWEALRAFGISEAFFERSLLLYCRQADPFATGKLVRWEDS